MPRDRDQLGILTVSAGLHGGLDVSDALDGDAVLVVAVDELILQLTDLVDQDTELVRDIRHILVAGLTPQGQLLLQEGPVSFATRFNRDGYSTYSDVHALPGDELHAAHDVLLHLDQLRQLAREVGAEGTSGIFTECMSCGGR
jgi:hypothetical protein